MPAIGPWLRKRLGLKESAALDPRQLAGTYENMDLLDLGQVVGHMAELEVPQRNSGAWSAMAYRENGGVWLITWPGTRGMRKRESGLSLIHI